MVANPIAVTGGSGGAGVTGDLQHVSHPPSQLPGEGCQLAGCLAASCSCCGLETNAVTKKGTAGSCVSSLQHKLSRHHISAWAGGVPKSLPRAGCSPAPAQMWGAQLQQAIDHRYGHMSWAHARCLLQRTRGLRSFESPDDSQHLL